jgi:glucose-6-phosphate isomerase
VAQNIYDVTNHSDWMAGEKASNAAASAVESTKDAAVKRSQEVANANRPSQLVVHKEDTTFNFEYTYGTDPYPPKG